MAMLLPSVACLQPVAAKVESTRATKHPGQGSKNRANPDSNGLAGLPLPNVKFIDDFATAP
jgi:hypothetical protein